MEEPRPAPVLVAAALGAVLGALALALGIASREWFSRDDFAFLAQLQLPDASLWAAYWPQGERFWPFYRPLGMESFFWLAFHAFGLEACGYFVTAIALHFATGALVFSLARRFGFAPATALATAALAVTRAPSLTEIYTGSVFHYVALGFFSLAALGLFLRGLRTGGAAARAGACGALGLALLCNEAAVTLPGALALGALAADAERATRLGLARLARALVPPLAVVAAYLAFRFGALAPHETSVLYAPRLGAHVPGNALALAAQVFAGAPILLAAGAAAAALAIRGRGHAPGAAPWLARVGLACLAWTALVALPFALLPFPQPRWAMNLEAPVCLGLGALLEAARRSLPAGRVRRFDAALAVCLVAAVPWPALVARARAPVGAAPRQLVEWIETARPPFSDAAQIVLLYGAPGLADAAQGEELRALCYGGGVLRAVAPATRRALRFYDLGRRAPRNALRTDSVYLVLRPDGRIERADPALLARELFRGVSRTPG